MKRIAYFLAALSFLCFLSSNVCAGVEKYITRPSSFRPLTDEEILTFKDKSFKEKMQFLTVYYLENKATYNATDEAVLNEMIKLDPQLALTIIKASENISKGSATFKEYYRQAVAEINVAMQERYPDNPEYLLDPDDYSSVTKVAHLVEVSGFSLDFTEAWSQARSFSETQKFDFGEAMLYSCARLENPDVLMGLSVFLKPDFILLNQKEGAAPDLVAADYSLSENMTALPAAYPRTDRFNINGEKYAGYAGNVVFPFYAHIVDNEKPAKMNAVFSFTVCRLNGECHLVRTPVLSQVFSRKSVLQTPVCYDLQSVERTLPEKDDIGVRFKKTILQQKGGETFLFVLLQDAVLNFRIPVLTVDNAAGLKFDEPLFSQKDGQFLFSVRLLNPEKLSFPLDLKLTVSLENRATATTVTIEKPQMKGNLFSQTFFSYVKTFGFGIEFLFLTPLLTLFLFLFYQAGLTDTASKRQTRDFVVGAGGGFLVFAVAMYAFLQDSDNLSFFDRLFASPYLNCVFMALFFASPVAYFFIADKLPRFMAEKIKYPAAVQGALIALLSCAALLLTPQAENFAKIFDLVEKQHLSGYALFIAGIIAPFAALTAFESKIQPKRLILPTYAKVLFCIGTVAQGVIFIPLIAFDAGFVKAAFLTICVVAGAFTLMNKRLSEKAKCFIPAGIALIGLLFLPFKADYAAPAEFSERLLAETLENSGTLFVSGYASGCATCQYNLLTANRTKNKIGQSGESMTVAGARLDNAEFAARVKEAELTPLPVNILFSRKHPNGYFMPSTISVEKLTGALRQADELK